MHAQCLNVLAIARVDDLKRVVKFKFFCAVCVYYMDVNELE